MAKAAVIAKRWSLTWPASTRAGTIATRQYTSQTPRFAFFALAAALCWLGATALKLALPQFQKLP